MTYKPVPVEVAREIAEKYGKSIVIIFAHDPEHGLLHTATYGTDPQNKAWAAQGGEIATKALGGLTQFATDFEDYRLAQARMLLGALKDALNLLDGYESIDLATHRSILKALHKTVKTAEGFLEQNQGRCAHDRLNEDGICRACGEDCR